MLSLALAQADQPCCCTRGVTCFLRTASLCMSDLSSRFLASISSLPRVAEEMAIEGVLNRLLTSRITQTIQDIPPTASLISTNDQTDHCYIQSGHKACFHYVSISYTPSAVVLPAKSQPSFNAFPHQLTRASLSLSANPAYTSEGSGTLDDTHGQ